MTNYAEFSVSSDCYARMWSFGEICVHCNCCGRYGIEGKDAARLEYWESQLKEAEEFHDFAPYPYHDLRRIQETNLKSSIEYYKKMVSYYQVKIGGTEQ